MSSAAPDDDPVAERPALAAVHTRTFRGNQLLSVLLILVIGMQVLGFAFLLGLPPFAVMVVFAATLALCIGVFAGEAHYTLYDDGIALRWRPLLWRWVGGKQQRRFVSWPEVRSFRHDRTMSRSLREFEYLEIDGKAGVGRLLVTDRQDRAGFVVFRDQFLARASRGIVPVATDARLSPSLDVADSAPTPRPATPSLLRTEPPPLPRPIPRRPGFHGSLFANLLTAFFAMVSMALLLAAVAGELPFGNLVRLFAVILPGTGYLIWRNWVQRG